MDQIKKHVNLHDMPFKQKKGKYKIFKRNMYFL